jgi:type II secretory ATPase GspE/PulE/Tfp pilus assembly ATPase PilB-like protein
MSLLKKYYQTLSYDEFLSQVEGDQADHFIDNVSYVVNIDENPDAVLKALRTNYGVLPYPTQNTTLDTTAAGQLLLFIKSHVGSVKQYTFDDLERISVCDWPAVPIGKCGPLVVMGHCYAPAENCWGVDPDLFPQVWITPKIYHLLLKETLTYFKDHASTEAEYKESIQTVADLRVRLLEYDEENRPIPVLEWMLDAVPMEEDERMFLEDSVEEGILTLPSGFAAALNFIEKKAPITDVRHLSLGRDLYERIPQAVIDRYKVICYMETTEELYVIVPKLDDFEIEDQIVNRLRLDKELVRIEARLNDIMAELERFETSNVISSVQDTEASEHASRQVVGDINLNEDSIRLINPKSINTTPEELLEWALHSAIKSKSSDVHVEQYKEQCRFRVRVDGILKTIYTGPLKTLLPVVSIVKNYCNMTLNNNDAQDGRFSIKFSGRLIDARVSAIPWRRRFQKLTIRLLDKSSSVRTLEEMGLDQHQLKTFRHAISRPQGLIVVTGPTGSGKSTTLYAALQEVNQSTVNVQTIEDPIEYEMEGLNQTQVDVNQHLTFNSVLRRILRADPDVIMVGEVRDQETAVTAAESALTGHLILTTLHSLDAVRAIGRLLAMGVQPYMLADSLIMLHAQRLLRRLCRCRKEVKMPDEYRRLYEEVGLLKKGDQTPLTTFMKNGCPECSDTGYKGRVAIMEMCPVDDDMRDLISQKANTDLLFKHGLSIGYEPMYNIALKKALTGVTSVEEALRLKRF